jgi:peptidase S24-like protein
MAREARLAGTLQGRSVVAVRAEVEAEDDGIHRGDYLLVRPEATAAAGSTVVAEVGGQLTVRRLVRGARGERQLVPVSPHVLPLVLPAERARILGPLVGVLRQKRRREATPASRPSAAESDPALRMIDTALDDATTHATMGRSAARVREITRDLRSLRDCYVGTSVPRLRQALLREAESCVASLRSALEAGRRRSA